MPLPRFFVPGVSLSAGLIDLPEEEAHHATRVLRLGADDAIAVFDGRGAEWRARIAVIAGTRVTVELQNALTPAAEPPVSVTLAVGLLKGDQMDDVVRDATMMGVGAIVPMVSSHVTVAERVWKGTRAIERWHRVAVASAKQCRRAVVPEIHEVSPFGRVIGGAAGARGDGRPVARFICLEPLLQDSMERRVFRPAGEPGSEDPGLHAAIVLVGPEGGWSDEEVSEAFTAGFAPLALGPRTIRAERAPLVALSVLWTRWGW